MTLYKYHSFAACIGEGFQFLAKHLLLVSKVMMPYYTVSALFIVLYMTMFTKLGVSQQAYGHVEMSDFIIAVCLYALVIIATVIANGRMFLMFRRMAGTEAAAAEKDEAPKKKALWKVTIKRTLQLSLMSLPFIIWPYFITSPGMPIWNFIRDTFLSLAFEYKVLAIFLAALLFIIAIIFLAPIIYAYYCRMMKPVVIEDDTEQGKALKKSCTFKAAYKKGLHHKGKILGVYFMVAFILTMALLVLILPGIVSINAYFSNVEGLINFNDTTSIPFYGYAMMIVVSTMAVALAQIFSVFAHASLLYLYGDIFTSEN